MKTIYFDNNISLTSPCAATVGFFDGVHKGHLFLIEQLKEEARRAGLMSAVITFDRYPRQILCAAATTNMLSTLDEKILSLSKTGIDICVIVPFTKELASLSAFDFMSQRLKTLCVRTLLTGYDNRFGHNRAEGFDDYVRYGSLLGISVVLARPFMFNGHPVSSSAIRKMLDEGKVEDAAEHLGAPYMMTGKVVEGFHIGRSMHFPTANLKVEDDMKLIPRCGVYAVKVRIGNSMEFKRGMMNIGMRPTFDGVSVTVEVNIFNCCDHLYGETIAVAVIRRLRDERKFESKEELMCQLKKDAAAAMECLSE